jgi:hypothetical protein
MPHGLCISFLPDSERHGDVKSSDWQCYLIQLVKRYTSRKPFLQSFLLAYGPYGAVVLGVLSPHEKKKIPARRCKHILLNSLTLLKCAALVSFQWQSLGDRLAVLGCGTIRSIRGYDIIVSGNCGYRNEIIIRLSAVDR